MIGFEEALPAIVLAKERELRAQRDHAGSRR
jgi:hypothetical protein